MKMPISAPYANVREAYQHLLEYDSAPNLPKLPPNAPVTLFVRNGYIQYRPFESFEAISRFMNSCVFHSNVIVNSAHLEDRFREMQVRKMYRMVTGKGWNPDSEKSVFRAVWGLFQKGNFTKMKVVTNRKGGNSYLFDLVKIKETNVSFPRQCKIIMATLLDRQRSAYTLEELKVLSNDLHKYGLQTKQPPFKILQYYLPQLHDAGFVEYPRKQYGDSDDYEGEEQ